MSQSDTPITPVETGQLSKELISLKGAWQGYHRAVEDVLGKLRKARSELARMEAEYSFAHRSYEILEKTYLTALLKEIYADDDETVRKIMDGEFEVDRAKLLGAYQEYKKIILAKSYQAVENNVLEGVWVILDEVSRVGVREGRDIRFLPQEILELLRERLLQDGAKITLQDWRAAFSRARYLQAFNLPPETIIKCAFSAIKLPLSVAGKRRCAV